MNEQLLKVSEQYLTGRDIIMFFDWCASRLDKECADSVTGIMMMSNVMLLDEKYKKLTGKLYDERKDPKWVEWLKAEQGIAEKYGDRDNNGEILRDSIGRTVINEQVIEATKELDNLKQGEFHELWSKVEAGRTENEKLLGATYQVKICGTANWTVKIAGATPHIIGILMHDTLIELVQQ
ncbi:MAG: hypothetical protein IKA48_02530 [Fibrobacter sp.]|nr:hypothetical protein [Fibrobacter sp.]